MAFLAPEAIVAAGSLSPAVAAGLAEAASTVGEFAASASISPALISLRANAAGLVKAYAPTVGKVIGNPIVAFTAGPMIADRAYRGVGRVILKGTKSKNKNVRKISRQAAKVYKKTATVGRTAAGLGSALGLMKGGKMLTRLA
jgi:hypothetical protein